VNATQEPFRRGHAEAAQEIGISRTHGQGPRVLSATPSSRRLVVAAVSDLVSAVKKDGRPVVRLRCADYGDEWVVECDVYPVDELSVEPRTAGPYVFGSAQEAKGFVETSLMALEILGCNVS
jgi:hypothetical protein